MLLQIRGLLHLLPASFSVCLCLVFLSIGTSVMLGLRPIRSNLTSSSFGYMCQDLISKQGHITGPGHSDSAYLYGRHSSVPDTVFPYFLSPCFFSRARRPFSALGLYLSLCNSANHTGGKSGTQTLQFARLLGRQGCLPSHFRVCPAWHFA